MSHVQHTANALYRVLAGEDVPEAQIERASAWVQGLDTPLDHRSFMNYVRTLQGATLPASSPLAALVPHWREAWCERDGFSEADAEAFLRDYLTHLDPNLLFRAPITAGYALWNTPSLERGFAYGSHSEQAWSLLYCDRGGARLRAGGRDLAIEPGQVLLAAPGALYTLQALPEHADWGYHWVVFHAHPRWRDWLDWPHFSGQISHLRLSASAEPAITTAFSELQDCLRSGRKLAGELSHNLLEQLILRCRASLPPNSRPRLDPRIQRARDFIDAHYSENFQIQEVARAANISASRLASLFRTQCGQTVLAYRDELRMAQAAHLLRNSSLGIAAVGAAVGYPDPAFFSRTFSRHVGVTPRDYQKQG
ncbi:helix-turn-helix domain-containing protein [Parahaliea mediterranea]|uniref:Helix-turn-helix domain-containing protein n=1 Tax=Parahaliea mediterranea TaxID=651086 RepID=A0A939DD16_9GAMM|nr:helix-turn-helix domain-containing protein [Parahaliea mediterranea]MBN7795995.1 helix-turn-helix domain-containing protein [Parahaliea mediterranea]